MAKRFTDTEIWNDPWYRKLQPEAKIFWRFLLDRCDVAGFWKKDYEMASFQCGFEVTDEHLNELNNGKERVADHQSYLQVVDFVRFQYGELSPDCKPHKPVYGLLEIYKNKGFLKGIYTLEEKEQDKEKDKEQDKEVIGKKSINYLSDIPLVDLTELSEEFKISTQGVKAKAKQLKNYCESKGKKYKNYKSFLSNALDKDKIQLQQQFPYTKPATPPPQQEVISPEEKEKIEARKAAIRANLRPVVAT